ncbi:MAG: hypothetical protein RIQ56_833, partial [Candidatus Parcubacteria bacterium]
TGEWGEFFPAELSPFGYNETVARERFPLTNEEVRVRGWNWHGDEDSEKSYMGPHITLPDDSTESDESICSTILQCALSGKPFKIVPQEFRFYKERGLPLPRVCPEERHRQRMSFRNPRRIWDRPCMNCDRRMQTTYAPDRPETVYCEECYLQHVY